MLDKSYLLYDGIKLESTVSSRLIGIYITVATVVVDVDVDVDVWYFFEAMHEYELKFETQKTHATVHIGR